ncbi:28S ribosomal protein S33, mitochondrial [Aphelenchoides besseyi]|nr:28S ribosomal protein S33, mitochondrial [Aphelenchoides besseyi]KAI6237428.1 28S ribosomal protein S33, mitochondrial [Aphelenchoides besseyi]
MSGRIMASRISNAARGVDPNSMYGKRLDRLSNRIFNEVIRPTNSKSMKVIRVMQAEPLEQRDDKHVDYYPNLPMFHYLTKMLRYHGLFFDEHVVWRQVQNELKILRGKVVFPVIGQGKRAQLKNKK